MRRPLLILPALLIATGVFLGLYGDSVRASSGSAAFTYSGSGTRTVNIFNAGVHVGTCDVICPWNEFIIRAKLDVFATTAVAAPANFNVSAPDSAIRQDSDVPITTANAAQDGSGKEFKVTLGATLTFHVDYDSNNDSILTCPNFGELSGAGDSCSDTPFDVSGTILNKDMVAPYLGDHRDFSDTTTLFSLPVCSLLIGLDVCNINFDASLVATLEATAGGAISDPGFHAQRSLTNGATTLNSSEIKWTSPNPQIETFHVPCSAVAGNDLTYKLAQNSYDSRLTTLGVTGDVKLTFAAIIPDITLVSLPTLNLLDLTGGPIPVHSAASDFTASLGTVLPDNQPPVINSVGGPYTGNEGSPIQFNASATDNCGTPTLRWDFSDGGVAFGANPQHTFADNCVCSGRLTATDAAGNTAVQDFSITVNNVNPKVSAGPDKTIEWGQAVSLHANGTDAGSVDSQTLQYSWDFNDPASPIGAVGQDVSHSFSQPGDYAVQVTVKDKDGGTGTATVTVHVLKHATTTVYTNPVPTSGVPTETSTFSAQVTDDLAQPVVGRVVTFTLGSGPTAQTASGTTDANGIAKASITIDPAQPLGPTTLKAVVADDALYIGSSASTPFTIAKRPTTITYNGTTKSNPNATVTVSATLVDDLGQAVAGKLVTFTLGSGASAQSVTATTDATGTAATTLKVNQHSGAVYPIAASFAGDNHYVGSTNTANFTVGNPH